MQGHAIEELKRSVADLKRRLGQHDNLSMIKHPAPRGTGIQYVQDV